MPKVNTDVILWALDWNNLSIDDLATKNDFKSLPKWITGEKEPTFKQLEKLAKKTNTIVPLFFMDNLPSVALQIPDFRTKSGSAPKLPSPELFEIIDDMMMRQDWLSEYFNVSGYDKVDYVGLFNKNNTDIHDVSSYMYEFLGLEPDWARSGSVDDAVRRLRRALEKRRISVSITGYPKNYTRRPFDVQEFRGFVLADDYAPIIFVNGCDAKVAQLFTLAHELVHLLFGNTGLVDNVEDPTKENPDNENVCNRIAAEFLAPTDVFVRIWTEYAQQDKAIDRITKQLKISYETCIRRALESNLISKNKFWSLFNAHKNHVDHAKPAKRKQGNPYANYGTKLGDVFTDAIFTAIKSNYLLYTDAYKLTGLHGETFKTYFERKDYVL